MKKQQQKQINTAYIRLNEHQHQLLLTLCIQKYIKKKKQIEK